jgi:hypothetical protein
MCELCEVPRECSTCLWNEEGGRCGHWNPGSCLPPEYKNWKYEDCCCGPEGYCGGCFDRALNFGRWVIEVARKISEDSYYDDNQNVEIVDPDLLSELRKELERYDDKRRSLRDR